jgi:hypothetical protein
VVKIAANERDALAPLFRENRYDTVLMNSVLEGCFGVSYADSRATPSTARLDSGAFTILGGNPKANAVTALLRHVPISYVTPQNSEWRQVLEVEFGNRLSPLRFTEFSSESLNVNHLIKLARELPDDLELRNIDKPLAERLVSDLNNEYFFENFESIEDFLKRGMGYCILHKKVIVSAATSMARCNKAVDIEIETKSEYRKRGLGTIVGAKLALDCLENGINPKWLAANVDSEKLAQKLGYVKVNTYETFEIGHKT